MSSNPIIAVVCGGPSVEAEVSRSSGNEVAKALKASYSQVHIFELDDNVGKRLRERGVEVVFPVLHGPPGEDGTFQRQLEDLRLPYVGCGVEASANACDKIAAKKLFTKAGLPVAKDVVVPVSSEVSAAVKKVRDALGEEVVVKPSRQGSAIGVSLCRNRNEIGAALRLAMKYDGDVLVEEMIKGKEITAAVLERGGLEVFPVVEVRTPEGAGYDYEHRYQSGMSDHMIPARISSRQTERVVAISKAAFAALGCRDLSRMDFVVPPGGEPVILEANTMPGLTPTSLYPDAARAGGMTFESVVSFLVEKALARSRTS